MKLSEFVKKRREELGLTWNNIADGGIAHNTFSKIVNDKQLTMQPATMEKLARVLKCSMGDIQACMAEIPSPLREEAEKPEGNAGISITAGAGKSKRDKVDKLMREKPYVTPAPDPEEPAEVFQTDEPEPEEHEDDEEQAEYTLSEVKTLEQIALNDYKQHLRELAWRIFTSGVPGVHTMKDVYADIGYALVQELGIKNKGGDEE